MSKTIGSAHIMITVSDLIKSKEFYTRGFSLKIKYEDKKLVGLTDGKFEVWMSESRDHKPKELKFDRNQIGLDHFAFRVAKLDELKEIEKNLKSLNAEMEEGGILDDGGPAIFVKDPDGMEVEFRLQK
jgi:catechol-2,3-dioxygenase